MGVSHGEGGTPGAPWHPMGLTPQCPKSWGRGGARGPQAPSPSPNCATTKVEGLRNVPPNPNPLIPQPPPDPKSRGSRTQHHPGVPPHGFLSWGGGTHIPLWAGGATSVPTVPRCPRSHADRWHRGGGGAVQGLVLRRLRHVSFFFFWGGGTVGRPLPQFGTRRGDHTNPPCPNLAPNLSIPAPFPPGAAPGGLILTHQAPFFLDPPAPPQRCRRLRLPARVPPQQAQEGLHHGALVSHPPTPYSHPGGFWGSLRAGVGGSRPF